MMSKWYAAHIIIATKLKKGMQKDYPAMENVVLVSAKTAAKAWKKAESIGKNYEQDVRTSTGKEAMHVFVGVRKLIECIDGNKAPTDGTEITYSFIKVDNRVSLRKLATGKPVKILYDE